MRLANYTLRAESWDAQRAARRYNPATVARVDLRDRTLLLTIGAGDSDDVDIYTERDLVIVSSINRRHGYAGVEVFDHAGDRIADVFCQSEEQLTDIVGRRGLDLTDRTIASRLFTWAMECFC